MSSDATCTLGTPLSPSSNEDDRPLVSLESNSSLSPSAMMKNSGEATAECDLVPSSAPSPLEPSTPSNSSHVVASLAASPTARASSCSHLSALLKKNFILKRRKWLSTLVELVLPSMVMLLLVWLHSNREFRNEPASTHDDIIAPNPYYSAVSHLRNFVYRRRRRLAIVPGSTTADLRDYIIDQLDLRTSDIITFETEDDMEAYIRNPEYTRSLPPIYAAAIFDRFEPPKVSYKLRFNHTSDLPSTSGDPIDRTKKGLGTAGENYYYSGFLGLQAIIDTYILSEETGIFPVAGINTFQAFWQNKFQVAASPFPTQAFSEDNFSDMLGDFTGLFIILVFIWPATRIVSGIVEEKELRIREGMKMMGLQHWTLIASWGITHFVMFSGVIITMLLITKDDVYNFSDKTFLFVLFLTFCGALFALCYLISTFFDRSRPAITFTTLFILIMYFLSLLVSGPTVANSKKVLSCLSPVVCLGLAAASVTARESLGLGVGWNNMSLQRDNFAPSDALMMFIFDTVILMLLALYCEHVIPSAYGKKEPWYFLCTPKWWSGCSFCKFGRADSRRSYEDTDGTFVSTDVCPFVEEAHSGHKTIVRIRGLRKEFPATAGADLDDPGVENTDEKSRSTAPPERGCCRDLDSMFGPKFVAVRSLTLDMYEGEIFTLLGHNGAGKTTTINMLTGLFNPTSGFAEIMGHDISQSDAMQRVRSFMGVCPQHDILYPDLTVREHLSMYAAFKGVPAGPERDRAVEEMIDRVGLGLNGDDKANALAGTLSGGQRRKLSVGIALIGGSKVVFLDEPSSGMDVSSQRAIWDMLLQEKKGRVIVLTTHSMEEAEIGDRIAIMSHGSLRCNGSSHYLKTAYGVGYTLTFSLAAETTKNNSTVTTTATADPTNSLLAHKAKVQSVVDFVKERAPAAMLLSSAGREVSFKYPFSESAMLPGLFDALDASQERLGIDTYGVSITTLTEVFLKVADEPVPKESSITPQLVCFATGRPATTPNLPAAQPLNVDTAVDSAISASTPTSVKVVTAPIPVPPAGEGVKDTKTFEETKLTQENTLDEHLEPNALEESYAILAASRGTQRCVCLRQTWALYVKRFHNAKRDKRGFIWQVIIPALAVYAALFFIKESALKPGPVRHLGASLYEGTEMPYSNWSLTPGLPDLFNQYLTPEKGGAFFGLTPKFVDPGANPLDFSKELLRTRLENPIRIISINPISGSNLPLAGLPTPGSNTYPELAWRVYLNASAPDATPVCMNMLMNLYYRAYTGWTGSESTMPEINASTQPLPLTADEAAFVTALIAIAIVLGLSFLPGTFASFIVREREEKFKHLQIICGVSPAAYWISAFLWDFTVYLVPFAICISGLAAFNLSDLVGDAIDATCYCFILFGIAIIPFSYFLSFFFKSHSNAQMFILIFCVIAGIPLFSVSVIMSMIAKTEDLNSKLKFLYRLLPPFAMSDALGRLSMRNTVLNDRRLDKFDWSVTLWNYIFLGADFIVYTLLVLLLEHMSSSTACLCCARRYSRLAYGEGDDEKLSEQVLLAAKSQASNSLSINADDGKSFVASSSSLSQFSYEDDDVAAERQRIEGLFRTLERQAPGTLARLKVDQPGELAHVVVAPLEAGESAKESSYTPADASSLLQQLQSEDLPGDPKTKDALIRAFEAGIVVRGLRKVYESRNKKGAHTAVKRLYFAVALGECFGFLGANGAGKSTTMKILTGDLFPTEGTATLGSMDIIEHPYEVRSLIGYCPQFDALLENLTAREHLTLFARIKGVPEKMMSKFIDGLLKQLTLEEYADRPAGTYSGGNKRKLCVGLALVGNPPVVFLDEPSTGVDPQARRFLWKLISSTMSHRAVVLTTHSMEEAEALSTRIGVMVNGRLRCLGTPHHLKQKYGRGYQVYIKVTPGASEYVHAFLHRTFGPNNYRILEEHGQNLRVRVVRQGPFSNIAGVFRVLEQEKQTSTIPATQEPTILAYSVSETDLEQLFVQFVREGEEELRIIEAAEAANST